MGDEDGAGPFFIPAAPPGALPLAFQSKLNFCGPASPFEATLGVFDVPWPNGEGEGFADSGAAETPKLNLGAVAAAWPVPAAGAGGVDAGVVVPSAVPVPILEKMDPPDCIPWAEPSDLGFGSLLDALVG